MEKESKKILIDKGFDNIYDHSEIEQFLNALSEDENIFKVIASIREKENTIDLKRGEFYPEILRCLHSLRSTISAVYNIPYDRCHPNFGSNGSIDTILTAMKIREVEANVDTTKNGGILVPAPTYFRNYNSSNSKKIKLHKVPLNKDWKIDTELFIEKIKEIVPTAIFLVTPNNPTGIPIKDKDIINIIENTPNSTLIVMDRTLANINQEIPSVDILKRFPDKQIAILHSFSKYYSLSHVRIGFVLYSNNSIANEIRPFLPLGISIEGAIKAIRILKDNGKLAPLDSVIENIKTNKIILENFCSKFGKYKITDFAGNYCLMMLDGDKSVEITNYLANNGIYVMGGHEFPDPINNVIRIHTGGDPSYMTKTTDLLKSF